jgi:hypothetical protein
MSRLSDIATVHGLISTAVRCPIRPRIAALQHKRWRNGPGHRTFPHDEPIPRRAARIREGRPPCLRQLAPSRPPWASPAGAGLGGDRTHGPARDYLARLGMHREFRAVLAEPGSCSDRELSDLGLVLAALAPATRGVVGKPLTAAMAARAHLRIMADAGTAAGPPTRSLRCSTLLLS